MDSVTQIALGAAVGETVMGRKVGNRALLWGGICGLFPDLDILIPLGDAVKAFTYHRGPSHSLFVLAGLTPVFVWLIRKLNPQTAKYRMGWIALVYSAFATHVLLDCLTVYGTQAFWPLPTPPVMWSTMFIIDPVYSAPLFFGILGAMMLSRRSPRGHALNTLCLVITTVYLIWSVGAKVYVSNTARESLQRQNIRYSKLLTVPAPFNTVLWRVLAMNDQGYYEGFYSLLDDTDGIQFKRFPRQEHLLDGIADHWPVKRLQWFTHGFYSVERVGDHVVMTDLRMGLEPNYVFRFAVGEFDKSNIRPVKSKRVRSEQGWEQLRWVWQRIWIFPDSGDTLLNFH